MCRRRDDMQCRTKSLVPSNRGSGIRLTQILRHRRMVRTFRRLLRDLIFLTAKPRPRISALGPKRRLLRDSITSGVGVKAEVGFALESTQMTRDVALPPWLCHRELTHCKGLLAHLVGAQQNAHEYRFHQSARPPMPARRVGGTSDFTIPDVNPDLCPFSWRVGV